MQWLIRKALSEISDASLLIDQYNVDEILQYFSRRADVDQVKDALKARFAVGIKKTTTDAGAGYETYTKNRVAEMIESGEIEVVTSGIGQKIINSLSNLFNQPTQSWKYLETEDQESGIDEESAAIIAKNRAKGSAIAELVRADQIANTVGSSLLFIDYTGEHLSYQAISPGDVRILHNALIEDNGRVRGSNVTDIEDATCIVCQLSVPYLETSEENQYLAIFGRSELYPNGRYVTYTAGSWMNIPDPDYGFDYLIGGKPANPLTWYANQHPDQEIPEYPIIVLHGGYDLIRDRVITISTSLYDACLEFDIAFSRLLKDSLNSARGKDILTNELAASLPRCLEGTIVLQAGQKFQTEGQPVENSVGALEILKNLAKAVGEGFSVPAYQVMMDQQQPEAGIALLIRTQPLLDTRSRRIAINRPQVDRLYEIERALIDHYTGVRLDAVQVWEPGRYLVPENDVEKTNRIAMAMDKKLVSYIQAIKDYHNLPTDEDAIKLIEKIKKQDELYPAPQPANQNQMTTRPGGALRVGLTRQQ